MGEAKRLAAGLHKFERAVLPHLAKEGSLSELVKASGLQEVEAMRALQWLEGKGCLKIATEERDTLLVTEKGQTAKEQGLPEEHALWALGKRKLLPVTEIPKVLPEYDKGATGAVIGALKRMRIPFITEKEGSQSFKWVEGLVVPEPAPMRVLAEAAKSDWRLDLGRLPADLLAAAKELLSRKGYATLEKRKEKRYSLTELGLKLTKAKESKKSYAEKLTPKMLEEGSWKGKEFRPFNVTINVPAKPGGRAHFVTEAIDAIRRIWLEMGFEEMEGNHVQTAFWDLDSLFVPQDHPAREMQDTFYIGEPKRGVLPADALPAVKAAHEDGGRTGSLGWRYPFSEEESRRNLLRTHTTVLSAQTLDMIRKKLKRMPGKYFSVAKVYRNEALDWKHLFEFYQVEGIVVAEGMTLAHLKGYLREFFGKMGYPDVRIRPAHFPYTEPSCEVEVYDPRKKQWVELGGCGIFRPEVTKTLIGKEVPVLAWGLGMERIITRQYDIQDLRELYRNDLKQLKEIKAW